MSNKEKKKKNTTFAFESNQEKNGKEKRQYLYISIAGIIASGKTTLAEKLGKVMKLPVYTEGVIDNTYLADFYKDQKKYAFPLQIYLLNKRFKQQQKIIWTGRGAVQDRTIYEDNVFCEMLKDDGKIDKRDYETYVELFENMHNFMTRPNLIVYLDVPPKEAYKRYKKRNRKGEEDIPLEYFERLYKYYKLFIQKIAKRIPVIRVDYKKYKTGDQMAKIIKEKWYSMHNIIDA
jgi:deoxyadenosine kinase